MVCTMTEHLKVINVFGKSHKFNIAYIAYSAG